MSTLHELPFKLPPYDHQMEALNNGWDLENFGYFMEMGTGKSKVFIDNALALYLAGHIDAVILFAPKGVYMNWIDIELPAHWPESVPMKASYWSSAKHLKLAREHEELAAFKGLKWLCVNVEAVAYDKGHAFTGNFMLAHKGRLLAGIDESTTIKNMKATRTKRLIKLGKLASYRRLLTGNPVPKSPTDLFSQCLFLSPRLLGFSSFYSFRNEYCIMKDLKLQGGRTLAVEAGQRNLSQLKEKIKEFSFRVTKDECLNLPEKTYQSWDVELTKEQAEIYADLKNKSVALLEEHNGIITTPLAITQLLRLHQVVCGHIKTDAGVEVSIPSNRLSTLMDVLEGTTGKIVIWAGYIPDILGIIDALKKEYGDNSTVHYYGDTSDDERRVSVNRFQNDHEARFFVGNPSTGRYGLTLTSSATMIYYSNHYDLEFRIQSEDRVHRIGQKANKVTYIDLVARNTVDEKIIKALRSKKQVSALITGDTWKEWIK